MIRLYHYTNAKVKTISPKYFGNNYFTARDKNISSMARSFFYTEPKPEALLSNCRYCYTATIPEKKLYNLITDTKNLLTDRSITEALNEVKRRRYRGIRYNNIVCLFYSIKVKAV